MPHPPTSTRHVLAAGLAAGASLLFGCAPGPRADGRSAAELTRAATAAAPGVAQVSYLRAGDPSHPRVIFIHGTPGDATAYADYLLQPVPGLEAVAVDRPGFGQSAREPVLSYAAQAAAVAPLLESRAGRWPIVVGHSLGGPIAARLAADHPDRVSGLVILAGSLDPALERPAWYNHLAAAPVLSLLVPRTIRTSNAEIFAGPAETESLRAVLARVRCPVILIHGDRDSLVPVANVDYVRRSMTGASSIEVIVIRGAGHFIPWRHEATVRDAIARLASGPPAPAPTAPGSAE